MADVRSPRERASILAIARVGEQLAIAASLLVLAGRLSVASFGVASLVYAYQSLAVTASDYGIGLTLLRISPDRSLRRSSLVSMRRRNMIVVLGGLAGALIAGSAGSGADAVVVLAGAVLWGASAEAYVRKSVSLRSGATRQVAASELAGSLVLLAMVLGLADDHWAAAVVAAGFVVKSLVEVAANGRGMDGVFGADGEDLAPGWVWSSQVLSFVTANIDYVVVQVVLGSTALGLYSLAYRFTVLIPSQVSYVVQRVSTVDLARAEPQERGTAASRLLKLLFATGAVLALVGAGAAPFVGDVLGRRWDDVTPVILILLIAVPWRLALAVAGISALVRDEVRALTRFEVGRLVLVTTSLVAGAQISLEWCAAFGAAATVAAAAIAHVASTLRPPRPRATWLVPAAGASLALLVVSAAVLG